MAYGKRRRYSRKRYGRKTQRRFRGRRSVKLIRRIAKGAIKRAAETKYRYIQTSTELDAATPVVNFVFPQISQGTGVSSRVGNQIMCQRNSFRGTINITPLQGNTTPQALRIRVIIGRVKSLDEPPSALDIANIIDYSTLGSTVMNCQINFNTFKAYYDKTFRRSVNGNLSYQSFGTPVYLDWKATIKWRKTIGFRVDGDIPNVYDYDKFLVVAIFTDQVSTGSLVMNNVYQVKYTYLDM